MIVQKWVAEFTHFPCDPKTHSIQFAELFLGFRVARGHGQLIKEHGKYNIAGDMGIWP